MIQLTINGIKCKIMQYIKKNISEPITFEGLTLCDTDEIEQILLTYSKNVCYGQKINEFKKRIIKASYHFYKKLCW